MSAETGWVPWVWGAVNDVLLACYGLWLGWRTWGRKPKGDGE